MRPKAMDGLVSYSTLEASLHEDLSEYISSSYGVEYLQQVRLSLPRPPRETTIRVNTLKITPEALKKELESALGLDMVSHPVVPDVIVITPHLVPGTPSLPDIIASSLAEVGVNRTCAMAVLRGSDVYAKGILAASPSVAVGTKVLITVPERHYETRGVDCTGTRYPLAIGTAVMDRNDIFTSREGLAVKVEAMTEFPAPQSLRDACQPGLMMLQNLPSTVAAAALGVGAGEAVLDMCAGVGGKTSHLSALMDNEGVIVALDKSDSQLQEMVGRCKEYGASNVYVARVDSSTILSLPVPPTAVPELVENGLSTRTSGHSTGSKDTPCCRTLRAIITGMGLAPASSLDSTATTTEGQDHYPIPELLHSFPSQSFDRVLLDPPCTSLGIRPYLRHHISPKDVKAAARKQRALFAVAANLVRVGGLIVYSTCTFTPDEDEEMVRYAIDELGLELVDHHPRVAPSPAVHNGCLQDHEARLVQRFDPHGELDTCGFFISKFRRHR